MVTLAVGARYAEQAATWLGPMVQAGDAALAVTDQPEIIAATGAEPVPYAPDGTHIIHAKRHAVRAGLERAWTAYYLDADHVPTGQAAPKLARLPPGAGAYCTPRPLPKKGFVPPDPSEPRAILDRMAFRMDVGDWQTLYWWGDWLYTVSRDDAGVWKCFCAAWDRFATLAAEEPRAYGLLLGDAVAMAFAAAVCGWMPHSEAEVLAPVPRAFRHLNFGGWAAPVVKLTTVVS